MRLLIILGIIRGELSILLLYILIIVLFFALIRRFGSWLLRIDEVIKLQKQILEELEKKNASKES
jgi:hypothetical protein